MTRPQFDRHRTAIGRTELSRPVKLAIDAQLITPAMTLLDYGCGRGDDVSLLATMGVSAAGWDPIHRPGTARSPADVVNLGYVVNVIEDADERAATLRTAWQLAQRVLVVAGRLEHETDAGRFQPFGDGFVTSLGTFQKLYTQVELRNWIEQTLQQQAWPAAPGVFFVFRDQTLCQSYLDSRYRRRLAAPKIRLSDVLFEQHRAILEPLMGFVTNRGRIPEPDEIAIAAEIVAAFGSIPKAFAVVRRVTGPEQWEAIRRERADELLLRLALDRLGGRAKYSELPRPVQLDAREFFSTYHAACIQSDKMLFSAGNMDDLDKAMRKAGIGKLTGNALYVHVDAVPQLPLLVRLYEGCARSYLGHVEGANIVKLSRLEPKVSYLCYPTFDTEAHPPLAESLRLRLGNVDVKHLDFRSSDNPPILHRKEEFLAKDDPRRAKFERLTAQEEKRGLYADTTTIGTRKGWNQVLTARGVRICGHMVRRAVQPVDAPAPNDSAGHMRNHDLQPPSDAA